MAGSIAGDARSPTELPASATRIELGYSLGYSATRLLGSRRRGALREIPELPAELGYSGAVVRHGPVVRLYPHTSYVYSLEVTKVRRGRGGLYFVPVNFVSAFSRVCCENEAGSSGVAETNSYRRRVFDNHRRSFRIGDEEKRDRSGRFITKDEIRVTFVTKTSSTVTNGVF